MSEQPGPTRACPTCGNTVPASARYCPSCGTRLNPADPFSEDDFEDALADVLGAPQDDSADTAPAPTPSPDEPTATVPPAVTTTAQPAEWTASSSDWSESLAEPTSGTWTAVPVATAPANPGRGRTFWIILAIVGFLVFCCCGTLGVLLAIGESSNGADEGLTRIVSIVVF